MRTVCSILVLVFAAIAQTDRHSTFEVVSIKPTAASVQGMAIRPGPGGGITIANATLKDLVAIAFNVRPFQITGGPAWADSIHYDVIAKPEAKPNPSETLRMIQSLLAERLQLAFHRETKDLPVYAMVLARKDGKLGPGLTQSKEGSCTPFDPSGSLPTNPGLDGGSPRCGWSLMSGPYFEAVSILIADVAPILSRHIGRPVIDKTGLEGKFDIRLNWGPSAGGARGGRGRVGELDPNRDIAETSIFEAFQEQLGLKLQSQQGPVETIVIDRVEKPSEN